MTDEDVPFRIPPHTDWTELEKWVWQEIEYGRIADINHKLGKTADPRNPNDWGSYERLLHPSFLEMVLLHDPWRSAVPYRGVQIVGAYILAPVDLRGAELVRRLAIANSRIWHDVNLGHVYTARNVSFQGCVIAGKLHMNSAQFGGSLVMRAADLHDVDLVSANISGQLSLDKAKVDGTLNMASAYIGGSLSMGKGAEFADVTMTGVTVNGQMALVCTKIAGRADLDSASIGTFISNSAEFGELDLRSSRIGGQIVLSDVKAGVVNMDSTRVGASLFMNGGSEFGEVKLAGARIEDQLALVCANVTGTLNAEWINIGQDLLMQRADFSKPISLIFAKIGGGLNLQGSKLSGLDLRGSRIEGELRLASDSVRPTWMDSARLVLRNARVGVIQDEPTAWPCELHLDGFTYTRFSGSGAGSEVVVAERGAKWFERWLARDEPYTPQPYHQCAKVLREMGHPEIADDVLYAGRERERKDALRSGNNPRATGLLLLKSFVGYGHGKRMLWHPLGWVFVMTMVGTVVLHLAGVPKESAGSRVTPWFFSLDLLLPIIQLYEPHYKVVLEGCAKYYFAVHKLMGYVLASFLIAGLAGLTK